MTEENLPINEGATAPVRVPAGMVEHTVTITPEPAEQFGPPLPLPIPPIPPPGGPPASGAARISAPARAQPRPLSDAPPPPTTQPDSPAAAPAEAPAAPPKPKQPPHDPNEVRLVVNGETKTGWQQVRIIRGIEIVPSHFDVRLTDLYMGDTSKAGIKAHDLCLVYIGDDLVITGRVDIVRRRIGPNGTVLRVVGRSLSRDLVDCSIDPAKVPTMQISQSTVLEMSRKLAGCYGIQVQAIGDVGKTVIPQMNFNLGEQPYPAIERIARYSQLLVYDDRDGSLNLASVGTGAMASGFVEGVNIEEADAEDRGDQRYSDYEVYLSSSYSLSDIAPLTPATKLQDKTVPVFRKLIVISEQSQLGPDIAKRRGLWEMARRYGRSQAVSLVTDTWRDSAKVLWTANCTVPVTAPHLLVDRKEMLIAQVAFVRDERGTHADLVLMPPQAFAPEPTVLINGDAEINQADQASRSAPKS